MKGANVSKHIAWFDLMHTSSRKSMSEMDMEYEKLKEGIYDRAVTHGTYLPQIAAMWLLVTWQSFHHSITSSNAVLEVLQKRTTSRPKHSFRNSKDTTGEELCLVYKRPITGTRRLASFSYERDLRCWGLRESSDFRHDARRVRSSIFHVP